MTEQPENKERLLRRRRQALLEQARREVGCVISHLDGAAASYRKVRALEAEDAGLRHVMLSHRFEAERATDFWSQVGLHSEWRHLLDYALSRVQELRERHLRAAPPEAMTRRR